MDIQMPVMGGIEACKGVISPLPKIPFLSAQVSDDYISMYSDSEAVYYMTKACKLKDLHEKLI